MSQDVNAPDEFDFAVIGGGVFGAATTWGLARRGANVALLEAKEVAAGASGGPGKRGVRANNRHEAELRLSRIANELWPQLDRLLGAQTGYERIGSLHLFQSAESLTVARRQVDLQERRGIPSRLLERGELQSKEPSLSDRVLGAVYCPDDGVADQTATTKAFAEAAKRAGAAVREGAVVAGFQLADGHIGAIVEVSGRRTVVRRQAVVLANASVASLLEPLGVAIRTSNVFPQVVFVPPVGGPSVRHLIAHSERLLALKELRGGQLMISGGWLGRWNEAAQRGEVIEDNVTANLADAADVFPALQGVSPSAAYADRAESVGPDLLPIIDRVPGFENLVVGAGWSGHGFAIAPAVADLLAAWLLDGRKPVEFAPFRWR